MNLSYRVLYILSRHDDAVEVKASQPLRGVDMSAQAILLQPEMPISDGTSSGS
jgi:hypothetical protein